MKKVFLMFMMMACASLAMNAQGDIDLIKSTINQMFDGMRKGDSTMVSAVFVKDAKMQSVITDENGSTQLRTGSLASFLRAIGTPHDEVWDERISFEQILIDGPLASVWTPYQFYRGGKYSHCGYNSFQMAKIAGEWKIVYIVDTRGGEDCK
jgi:hypothetical protein